APHKTMQGTVITLTSPLTGEVKALSEAVDPVFAQGVMGQGVLLQPTEGVLVAPCDAEVSVLFPTKHAIGLVTAEGLELLMHIGMDTVNLDGQGFEALVKQGDQVKAGQTLIQFDIAAISEAGYATEMPLVVTNQDTFTVTVEGSLPHQIKANDKLVVAVKK
ncbi:TPA: PTS glucose transporter subunit IIA, partial [Streptococcus pyogenes]|nr:PTS glucose transporter subunit IIA [Streptococcus pyogenes]